MLQQTQVTTVIPYFEKFINTFPTIRELAQANEDDVLHLWTGLGYYSRARNLLKTAKLIANHYQGKFPEQVAVLQTLPGIGRSTAAAIVALSMHQVATILDGNVKRVLSRVYAITAWNNEASLWKIAEKLTPKNQVAQYTQAMMDLGAMICTRGKPACLVCPLQQGCRAFQQQRQAEFPGTKPRKALPVKQVQVLILKNTVQEILLEKRPTSGIWGGLWSLPEYHGDIDIKVFCEKRYHCQISTAVTKPAFRHTFTHFHLDITPVEITVSRSKLPTNSAALRWYNPNNPATIGLAAPIKKLLMRKA